MAQLTPHGDGCAGVFLLGSGDSILGMICPRSYGNIEFLDGLESLMKKHITDQRSPRGENAVLAYLRIARRKAARPHTNVLFRKNHTAMQRAEMVPQYARIERGRLIG